MKRAALISTALAALASLGALLSGMMPPEPEADPAFVRGVALGLFATDPEWNYADLVEEIRNRGASDVLLTVPLYQRDRFATGLSLLDGHSPSLANVERTLHQVRAAGMRATLMPIVRLSRRHAQGWRGVLTPADGPDAWFAAYAEAVLPLVEVAQRARATRFVVGSELNSLEAFEVQWRAWIGEVRNRFDGRLVYSANWDHFAAVPFWDALDEAGVTGYFPLQQGTHQPTRPELAKAWRGPRATLAALRERTGRPVLITEIGYPSQPGAALTPWDDTASDQVDLGLQARLLEGFCHAFSEAPPIDGFFVWNWFGFGGPRDSGFSPRGKPAAGVLGGCLKRPWGLPPSHRSGA